MNIIEQIKQEIEANLAAISYNDEYQHGYEDCGMAIIKFLNTLQEPEVDLKKEIENCAIAAFIDVIDDDDERMDAINWLEERIKYFYNLGKNATGSEPMIKGWVARDMNNHLRIYDNADCWGQGIKAFELPVPFNSVKKSDDPIEVELIIRRTEK